MSLVRSKRERRLWGWLGIVLIGIYATLGQTPKFAAFLRDRGELRDTTFFILFVGLSLIAILFIRRRPGRAEIAVGVGILAVYLTAWLRIGTLEERTHLFEYGLVAALVHEALLERQANGWRGPPPALLALIIAILLGWLDEGIQSLLPNRVYDVRDVVFNAVAAGLIIGARWALAWVRQRIDSAK